VYTISEFRELHLELIGFREPFKVKKSSKFGVMTASMDLTQSYETFYTSLGCLIEQKVSNEIQYCSLTRMKAQTEV
jgi:hypothetical protein